MQKIILFILIFIIYSCHKEFITETELKKYIQNNSYGVSKTDSINGVKIKVTYYPSDLLIANELHRIGEHKEIESLYKKYGDYCYFILSIQSGSGEILNTKFGNMNDYTAMVDLLSYEIKEYVFLINSLGDTVQVSDFVYPRMYNTTPNTSIMFAFKANEIFKSDWFVLNIKDFGLGLGNLQCEFYTKNLETVPHIKF
jgi:hypothetical protein